MSAHAIDQYLSGVGEPQRQTLEIMRERIRQLLPFATETVSYGIPTHDLDGVHAIGYAAFTRHCSLFPYSGHVVEAHTADLSRFTSGKGTIQFAVDQPMPLSLLRRLIATRLTQMSTSWPRTGHARMFYADGALKLKGSTRDGKAHGTWQWFRRDGSIMRVGHFTRGVPSGMWSTYDRAGTCVRSSPPPTHLPIA